MTLVEVMASVAVFGMILVMIFSMVNHVSSVWRLSVAKIDAFQGARLAFDTLTRNLSQSTLNTYLDYDNPNSPTRYLRKSELKFLCAQAGSSADIPGTEGSGQVCFFLAPEDYTLDASTYGGMASLLNVCGYYVSFCADDSVPNLPAGMRRPASSYRYRLMQLLIPTESNTIYTSASDQWFANVASATITSNAVPIGENIIALILRPQDVTATNPDLTTDYLYDSTLNNTANPQPVTANQLPPVVEVTMVVIDENSAKRLENGTQQPSVIADALAGKFAKTANYSDDLQQLEQALTQARVKYRIFSSMVPLRESKWTK